MVLIFSRVILISFIFATLGCSKIEESSNYSIAEQDKKTSYLGYSSKMVPLNGLNFHYVEAGSGPLILFLHGFPYFAESWDPLLKPLSKSFHVVAPDNRGYGYSAKPSEINDYKIKFLVEDVVTLINKLSSDKPVVVVGHDWGGVLAWSVAQQYPNLVSKVIVINAPPFNVFLNMLSQSDSQREASNYISMLTGWASKLYFSIKGPELMWGTSLQKLHENGQVSDEFKHAFLAAWEQEGAAEAAVKWYTANIPEFDEINNNSYWPNKNARVKVPSLLIWSKHDRAFSDDTFQEIQRYVDNLEIKVIDTTSHTPFLDHTKEVLDHIQKFIEKPITHY